MNGLVGLEEVDAAARRIGPYVAHTPLVPMDGSGIVLKAESLQPSGSFKIRGALNTLLLEADRARAVGAVAHSSGNHARAVAVACERLGIAATVVMPDDAPRVKLDATRAAGADVVVVGPDSAERAQRAAEIASDRGSVLVEPYDSDAVLAATGTIAGEILDDLGPADAPTIYVPISGGGLAGGVSAGAKLREPAVRVVGVEPELAATAQASRREGRRVAWPASSVSQTIADGLRVRQVGRRPWRHIEQFVDEIVSVTEDEIVQAMRTVAFSAGLVAEPSGAVATAAALAGRETQVSAPRVAIVTGRNVDPMQFAQAVRERTPRMSHDRT